MNLGNKKRLFILAVVGVSFTACNGVAPECGSLSSDCQTSCSTCCFKVNENSPPGTFVGDLNQIPNSDGLDKYLNSNRSLEFELQDNFICNQSDVRYTNWFTISNSSIGTVRTVVQLDSEYYRDLCDGSCLQAFAVVSFSEPQPGEGPLVFPVSINLADLNDNAPQFLYTQSISNLTVFSQTIEETEDTGVQLFCSIQLTATDADTISQEITYTVLSSTDDVVEFSVSVSVGKFCVYNLIPLDRESISNISFIIKAQDEGNLTSNITVVLTILDVNDNPPVFTDPILELDVFENTTVNSVIAQYTATDEDIGFNAAITYSIISNNTVPFVIDNSTGELYVSGELDADDNPPVSYSFAIVAQDGPGLFSQEFITVNIHNVNNNLQSNSSSNNNARGAIYLYGSIALAAVVVVAIVIALCRMCSRHRHSQSKHLPQLSPHERSILKTVPHKVVFNVECQIRYFSQDQSVEKSEDITEIVRCKFDDAVKELPPSPLPLAKDVQLEEVDREVSNLFLSEDLLYRSSNSNLSDSSITISQYYEEQAEQQQAKSYHLPLTEEMLKKHNKKNSSKICSILPISEEEQAAFINGDIPQYYEEQDWRQAKSHHLPLTADTLKKHNGKNSSKNCNTLPISEKEEAEPINEYYEEQAEQRQAKSHHLPLTEGTLKKHNEKNAPKIHSTLPISDEEDEATSIIGDISHSPTVISCDLQLSVDESEGNTFNAGNFDNATIGFLPIKDTHPEVKEVSSPSLPEDLSSNSSLSNSLYHSTVTNHYEQQQQLQANSHHLPLREDTLKKHNEAISGNYGGHSSILYPSPQSHVGTTHHDRIYPSEHYTVSNGHYPHGMVDDDDRDVNEINELPPNIQHYVSSNHHSNPTDISQDSTPPSADSIPQIQFVQHQYHHTPHHSRVAHTRVAHTVCYSHQQQHLPPHYSIDQPSPVYHEDPPLHKPPPPGLLHYTSSSSSSNSSHNIHRLGSNIISPPYFPSQSTHYPLLAMQHHPIPRHRNQHSYDPTSQLSPLAEYPPNPKGQLSSHLPPNPHHSIYSRTHGRYANPHKKDPPVHLYVVSEDAETSTVASSLLDNYLQFDAHLPRHEYLLSDAISVDDR